jgi:hypothetical protein
MLTTRFMNSSSSYEQRKINYFIKSKSLRQDKINKLRKNIELLRPLSQLSFDSSVISKVDSKVIIVDFLNYLLSIISRLRKGLDNNNTNVRFTLHQFKQIIAKWIPELILLLELSFHPSMIIFVAKNIELDDIEEKLKILPKSMRDVMRGVKLTEVFFKTLRSVSRYKDFIFMKKIRFVIVLKEKNTPNNCDDLITTRLANQIPNSIIISNDRFNKVEDFNHQSIKVSINSDPYDNIPPLILELQGLLVNTVSIRDSSRLPMKLDKNQRRNKRRRLKDYNFQIYNKDTKRILLPVIKREQYMFDLNMLIFCRDCHNNKHSRNNESKVEFNHITPTKACKFCGTSNYYKVPKDDALFLVRYEV